MFAGALAKIGLRGGPQIGCGEQKRREMYECKREQRSVLGEADRASDSGFVRWTKIYLSPIELERPRWRWRERKGAEEKEREREKETVGNAG